MELNACDPQHDSKGSFDTSECNASVLNKFLLDLQVIDRLRKSMTEGMEESSKCGQCSNQPLIGVMPNVDII